MIGTNIRSIRHLFKILEPDVLHLAFAKFYNPKESEVCEIAKIKGLDDKYKVVLFNNFWPNNKNADKTFKERFPSASEKILEAFNSYASATIVDDTYIVGNATLEMPVVMESMTECLLFPSTFNKDYERFKNDNKKMISDMFTKYSVDPDGDYLAKYIYAISNGSKNFYQWMCKMYDMDVSFTKLSKVMYFYDNYKQLFQETSKKTITAYKDESEIDSLLAQLHRLRKEKRVHDSINMFNTVQKKLLRGVLLNDKEVEAFSKFYKLSDVKKINFIKKMSTITDAKTILTNLKYLTHIHFDWDKESLINYINNNENIDCEVLVNNGDTVLVKANDYESVKCLGKTTSWCISKNKAYWNNYCTNDGLVTPNNSEKKDEKTVKQFILFDFSKKEDDKYSIIGFTVESNIGITAAHNFENYDIKESKFSRYYNGESMMLGTIDNADVFSIIKNKDIDDTLIFDKDKLPFKWDKKSMFDYLYKFVDKENVLILLDKDGMVVLSIRDGGIKDFLKSNVGEYTYSGRKNYQRHLLFFNFNLDEYNSNRMWYSILNKNEHIVSNKETPLVVGNCYLEVPPSALEGVLSDYNLPYIALDRCDNEVERFKNHFLTFNLRELKKIKLSKDKFKHVMENEIDEDDIFDKFENSSIEMLSFGFLELFYSNGSSLSDYLSVTDLSYSIRMIFDLFVRENNKLNKDSYPVPDDKLLNSFVNKELKDLHLCKYAGYYLYLIYFIANENNKRDNSLYLNIISYFYDMNITGCNDAIANLMVMIGDKLNFNCNSYETNAWKKLATGKCKNQILDDFINNRNIDMTIKTEDDD